MSDILKFKEAIKHGIKIVTELQLEEVNLSNNSYEGIEFHDCWLSDVDFTNTNLKNCKFISCNLKCTNFTNTDLTNVLIQDCALEGVIYNIKPQINGLEFNNNSFYGNILNQEDIEKFFQ
jgi:uncharacterized protein YjbI with pentapeptide repeats